MQCPIDQTTLVMTERQGVEIDYCPTCRGVWLDRGELDKILDRAHGEAMPGVRSDAPRGNLERTADTRKPSGVIGKLTEAMRERDHDDDRYDQHGRPRKKKKESFLDDLFDF